MKWHRQQSRRGSFRNECCRTSTFTVSLSQCFIDRYHNLQLTQLCIYPKIPAPKTRNHCIWSVFRKLCPQHHGIVVVLLRLTFYSSVHKTYHEDCSSHYEARRGESFSHLMTYMIDLRHLNFINKPMNTDDVTYIPCNIVSVLP